MDKRKKFSDLLKQFQRPEPIPPERRKSTEVAAVNPPVREPQNVSEIRSQPVGFLFSEFHMTIRLKIAQVTQKQFSMLLKVAIAKATNRGVDVPLYLMLEYLYSNLKKSGADPLMTKNEKDRQALLLGELILSCIRGSWLSFGDLEKLPPEVILEIRNSGWLPNDRTLNSWKQHWQLENYLEVRIVPVEQFLNRQPNSAERYSGYTKGYGQDGSPTAPHKTKDEPSDGTMDVEPPSFTLHELHIYQSILNQILRAKSAKRKI